MAVISPVIVDEGDRTKIVTWTMATADTANPIGINGAFADFADRSVTVTGTFGGGTITMQGSNDGTNFFDLTDGSNNALSFAAARLEQIYEATRHQKPTLTGGAGVALAVTMFMRKSVTGKMV